MDGEKKVRSLKNEIERRTQNTTKLIALEAQKAAIGEMVLERLDDILALLREAGFKVTASRPMIKPTQQAAPPPNTLVFQDTGAEPGPPPPVKNPCAMCGAEAHGTEDVPGGGKKFLCKAHYMARAKEKADEQLTKSLLGNEGTLFKRPVQNAPAQAPPKVIINAAPTPDPLKGPFPNGDVPPNNVLDD